jgi:hypothetical protein
VPTETRCGVERWAIKTLTDPAAGQVRATPRNTTVLALTQRDVPVVKDATPRLAGVETTTFRVRARLVGYKREEDSDIHLAPLREAASSDGGPPLGLDENCQDHDHA